ncbi:hypothetical protein N9955_00245 [bacterium]|nr:hypothetical protein [bacterium]
MNPAPKKAGFFVTQKKLQKEVDKFEKSFKVQNIKGSERQKPLRPKGDSNDVIRLSVYNKAFLVFCDNW